jgi:hypothetical protein
MWEYLECPTPATEIDDINQQIDTTIKQNRQVRIYLNETDLNNYLEFRNETGELENFNYILISDKPSTPEKPPAPENSPEENFGYLFNSDKKNWGGIIASAVGGGFAALGVMVTCLVFSSHHHLETLTPLVDSFLHSDMNSSGVL